MAKSQKSSLSLTRARFRSGAKPVDITINGNQMQAMVKEFSTGSLGWFLNAKTTIDVDGQLVPVQIGLNLTIVGSKDLPPDESAPAAAPAAAPAPANGGAADTPAAPEF